jgi:hypothetical protein
MSHNQLWLFSQEDGKTNTFPSISKISEDIRGIEDL